MITSDRALVSELSLATKQLMAAWVSLRWEDCHDALDAIRSSAASVAWSSLKELVQAHIPAHRVSEGILLVCDPQYAPGTADRVGKAIDSICGKVGPILPHIIVSVSKSVIVAPFASRVLHDLSYVNFPEQHASDPDVIIHEMAHGAMISGNRFLDEGLADYFSDRRPSDLDMHKGVPLREILTSKHSNDVQLAALVKNREHLQGLRMRGRDLAAALIDRCVPGEIGRLFQKIYEQPSSIVERVESALGSSLEAWDSRPTPRLSVLLETIIAAQLSRDHVALLQCADAAAELASGSPSWRPAQAAAVAIYGALRECATQGQFVDPSLLAAADQWVEDATRKGLPASRKAALDGHRELIALLVAHSHSMETRAVLSAGRVDRAYRLALSLDPTDIEVQTSLRFFERVERLSAPVMASGPATQAIDRSINPNIVLALRNVNRQTASGFRLHIDELTLRQGEKIALIGPNGSGKSTLIEAIVGLVRCEGRRAMFGADTPPGVLDLANRRRVGALITNAPLSRSLTVRETVRMVDAIYARSDPVVYEAMSLREIEHSRVGELSRGQMQRLLVYMAAGHNPELLLLDEASIGLDRRHSAALRDLIFGSWGSDRTVVFCSHIMSDLQRSDRIIAMAEGHIVALGALDELVGGLGWVWKGSIEGVNADACQAIIRSLPQFKRSSAEGRSVTCYGGPLFGRAFSQFASGQPFAAMSLSMAGIGDVIDELSR